MCVLLLLLLLSLSLVYFLISFARFKSRRWRDYFPTSIWVCLRSFAFVVRSLPGRTAHNTRPFVAGTDTHTHTRLDSLVCTTAHLSFFFFLICIFLLFFLVELWVSLTVCISRASVATEFHDNGNPRLSTPATSARSTRRQLMVAFISSIEQIQRLTCLWEQSMLSNSILQHNKW